MKLPVSLICLPLFILGVGACSQDADWPQFRGPGGQGTSAATGLPVTWSAEQNIIWKTALPGYGASSPIVVGEHIFVSCYSGYGIKGAPGDEKKLLGHLVCINGTSGKIEWDKSVPSKPSGGYSGFIALHGFASGTPVSDGKALYVFFGPAGVFAFDLTGQQLWTASAGVKGHGFGTGASPILSGNLVIVNASVESGRLVALDKTNGKEVWSADGIREAWDTPVLVETEAHKQELAVITQDKLLAFDPATGKPLWDCAGSKPPRYICPSAVAKDGIVYAINGANGPVMAVRAGGSGDVTASHVLWTLKKGSNVPSPVYHDGHLYWSNESGGVSCLDAKTGTVVYQERLNPAAGIVYASPLVADGKLYYVSRDKGAFVLAAKPKFEILAHNRIATDDSIFNASPSVSGKHLLLRSDKFLYCIGEK
jgi:outer membrane protein assembly factor BamB